MKSQLLEKTLQPEAAEEEKANETESKLKASAHQRKP